MISKELIEAVYETGITAGGVPLGRQEHMWRNVCSIIRDKRILSSLPLEQYGIDFLKLGDKWNSIRKHFYQLLRNESRLKLCCADRPHILIHFQSCYKTCKNM